jgi:putative ABC transport system substrate-binding protein
MRRREFIASLGAATVLPTVAQSQQPAMPLVGYLDSKVAAQSSEIAAFRQGLSEAGFIEGRNVAIEFRWAENHLDRLPALAAELVRHRVAVIVTNNATTPAAKAATSTIPIVFGSGGDPVASGLVTSLSRPGGNVTGISFTTDAVLTKRLELLHEFVPQSVMIALLWDPNGRNVAAQLRRIDEASRALGRKIEVVKAGTEGEIEAAFETLGQAGAGALLVGSGAFYYSQHRQIVALAGHYRLPAMYHLREFVVAGGLMSYGASVADANRRVGLYVGRILKGQNPGELPVELPTRFQLVFNLATAKSLKLDIPPKMLALADEVIE